MKKVALSITLLSVAAVSAYLPQDEAKIGQMKGQCARLETAVPEKHTEMAGIREGISRTESAHTTLEQETRQPVPQHKVEGLQNLKARLHSCEAERDGMQKEIARLREGIAREEAAADIREKDSNGVALAA